MKRSTAYIIGCGIFAACTIIGIVVFSFAEVYTLIADEDLPIRKDTVLPYTPDNILITLKKGDELRVNRCINYESDITLEVVVSENTLGYVNRGAFRLERVRWPWGYLFSSSEKIVWSCVKMFDHRKFDKL